MLTVVGFPRSGTNFLTRMLAHYVDGPGVEVWPGTPPHAHVNKIHWRYQDSKQRTLAYIYRDPRDCALSGWEYVQRFMNKPIPLLEFLECHFSGNWDLWPTGWREHTSYWMGKEIPFVSYAMLCDDREGVLRRLAWMLDLGLDERRIEHAVQQSYNFGERHDGRWMNELPKDAMVWLNEYCGSLMPIVGCP